MSIVVTSNFTPPAAAPSKEGTAPVENKETTPAAAATPAETLEASGASNDDEIETEVGEGADPAAQAKPKAKSGFKKKIDKLNRRLADAEREVAYLRGNADAKKTPDGPKPEVKVEASTTGEPDPDKFGSHAEYLKAVAKWTVAEDKKADQAKAETERQKDGEMKAVERLATSIASFKESHKDFDDVVTDEFKTTPALERAILDSEDPAILMYELCKDPEAYEKIVALPEKQLIRALGRFEAKIEPRAEAKPAASQEKPTSKAPAPINPVGNKGTGAGKKSINDPNLSQREYEAIRAEQQKSRSSAWG